jgi:hypothetical protein
MKHGMFGTKVYGIWAAMIRRCRNKNDSSYKYYGERGIKVCDEWLNFENFYTDMGDPPDDHSIERKDHNGNYCKENCVWADWITQENNRTNNRIISYNGKKQTIAQWSREFNVRPGLISNRLYKGWTVEKALTCPVDIRQRKHLGRAGVKN